MDYHDFITHMAQFGPPTFSILPHTSDSKRDRIVLGFEEAPEKIVEIQCPIKIGEFGLLSAQDIKTMLRDRLQSVIDAAIDDTKLDAMESVMQVLGQVMRKGEIKYLPATTSTLTGGIPVQAEAVLCSEVDNTDLVKDATSQHWVPTGSEPPPVESGDSPAGREAVSVQNFDDDYDATRNVFRDACAAHPGRARLTSWLEVKNFIQDIDVHSILGEPLLYAIPHPTSTDPLNPVMSQFLFTYSNVPDRRLCICYGNGLLSRLLSDNDFKKHVNDHVRELTKFVENPGGADMKEWPVTEYVLGADGEAPVVVSCKDTMKLSPLVREIVMEYREHHLSISKQAKRSGRSVTNPNRSRPTNCFISNYSLTPSGPNSPYPALITDEIRTILHGKYEEYGDPVFRRISNLANPGTSQIKLTFAKVPSSQFQLLCDFLFDGDGEGGLGPGGVDEEEMLADITRRVKRLLLGKDDGEDDGIGDKAVMDTPATTPAPRKRNRLVKRRLDRALTAWDTSNIEEVDQEIEAVAVQSRFWNCSRL